MENTIAPKERIFEINKQAFSKVEMYCDTLNQNPKTGKPIKLNLEFECYSDVGFTIECLLNSISSADEDSLKKEPLMFQEVCFLAEKIIKTLPLEFLDVLLVKDLRNENSFTDLKNL